MDKNVIKKRRIFKKIWRKKLRKITTNSRNLIKKNWIIKNIIKRRKLKKNLRNIRKTKSKIE